MTEKILAASSSKNKIAAAVIEPATSRHQATMLTAVPLFHKQIKFLRALSDLNLTVCKKKQLFGISTLSSSLIILTYLPYSHLAELIAAS